MANYDAAVKSGQIRDAVRTSVVSDVPMVSVGTKMCYANGKPYKKELLTPSYQAKIQGVNRDTMIVPPPNVPATNSLTTSSTYQFLFTPALAQRCTGMRLNIQLQETAGSSVTACALPLAIQRLEIYAGGGS